MVIRFYGEEEILRNFQVLPIRLKKVTPHFVNFHISTSSIQHRNCFHNILSSAGLNGGKKDENEQHRQGYHFCEKRSILQNSKVALALLLYCEKR